MKKDREYYNQLFSSYPDVVTVPDFQRMLGGISEPTARKLLRGNYVRYFYIRNKYFVPKICIIDYVLSEDYAEYRLKLKARI